MRLAAAGSVGNGSTAGPPSSAARKAGNRLATPAAPGATEIPISSRRKRFITRQGNWGA